MTPARPEIPRRKGCRDLQAFSRRRHPGWAGPVNFRVVQQAERASRSRRRADEQVRQLAVGTGPGNVSLERQAVVEDEVEHDRVREVHQPESGAEAEDARDNLPVTPDLGLVGYLECEEVARVYAGKADEQAADRVVAGSEEHDDAEDR